MKNFLTSDKNLTSSLKLLMQHAHMYMFTYSQETDEMNVYDSNLTRIDRICGILRDPYRSSMVHPDDMWKLQEFLEERLQGPIEIRVKKKSDSDYDNLSMDSIIENNEPVFIGSMRNVTKVRKKEQNLQEQAQKDSLTGLYNHLTGKMLISEYLSQKTPFSSCGMMLLDIDYFKNINDNYGHLFGDEVLTKFAEFLQSFFRSKDVLVRAGGDEFVIFLKDISHQNLIKKSMNFVHMVRKIQFSQKGVSITCSVGVCYLPENVAVFTYNQLFENADWALYQAKTTGRNRYVFCDNLKRFEVTPQTTENEEFIDSRYLRNDIVATAFELFEKHNSFDAALTLLLKVIGIRYQLDRVTVIRTNIKNQDASRQYQWLRPGIPQVLDTPGSFTKEDFQTLFRSYDKYGTTVLQHHDMEMYSPDGRKLLMQGNAKTVLYAAMYCEGKYTGAISYVVCSNERYWSKMDRKQIGELSKIISAHMAKRQAINMVSSDRVSAPGYDSLTGLLSFARFKEEAERIIVSGYATSYIMMYSDFCGFKYFNQKYGYAAGDQILKEFSSYLLERMPPEIDSFFTRVIADQFILFTPHTQLEKSASVTEEINNCFSNLVESMFPGANLKIRTGIYRIDPSCVSASVAIDAANYARKQIQENSTSHVCFFDEQLRKQQQLENEIIGDMAPAIDNGEFQIFYQPKISLDGTKVTGAEALIRWIRPCGTVLTPNMFVPLYEKTGQIIQLDYYVMEKVAASLSRNIQQGLPAIPLSVNLSALHARDDSTVEQYLSILKKYGLSPSLIQIEITESDTVFNYDNVRQMFSSFQQAGFATALDHFGAGFSVMNLIADLPLNVVKLDRIFINKCQNSHRGSHLIKETIHLLKELGFTVLCQGIETQGQLDFLRQTECDEIQGNLFYKPLPENKFRELS